MMLIHVNFESRCFQKKKKKNFKSRDGFLLSFSLLSNLADIGRSQINWLVLDYFVIEL